MSRDMILTTRDMSYLELELHASPRCAYSISCFIFGSLCESIPTENLRLKTWLYSKDMLRLVLIAISVTLYANGYDFC